MKKKQLQITNVTEPCFMVSWRELERFIEQETGQTYNIVEQLELKNNLMFCVLVKEPTEGDKQGFQEFLEDPGVMYRLHPILNNLCGQGKLQAGRYLINICW